MADSAAILDVFRAIAGEFDSKSDATVTVLINIEVPRLSVVAFGTAYNEAVASRVAHRLTLQARDAAAAGSGGALGGLSSLRTGDISVGYGGSGLTISPGDSEAAYYSSSSHGLRYLQLRDSRGTIGPMSLR